MQNAPVTRLSNFVKRKLTGTAFGRLLMIAPRLAFAIRDGVAAPLTAIFPWLVSSREIGNWTYDTTSENKLVLCSTISIVSGVDVDTVIGYCDELYGDDDLKEYLKSAVAASSEKWQMDPGFKPGRRLAYYLLARALKPKLVVEAGVDKGLTSILVSRALELNAREGRDGRYIGIEYSQTKPIDVYRRYPGQKGPIETGDSIAFLEKFKGAIDLFIHETLATAGHMRAQLAAVEDKMSPNGVIASGWTTAAGIDYALRKRLRVLVHKDEPVAHWHSGSRVLIIFPIVPK
jgi:hypothetical protein